MKLSAIALVCAMLVSACTGISVNEHKTDGWGLDNTIPGKSFKSVEIYQHNAIGASYSYVVLLECNANGEACVRVTDPPHYTPGIVSSLIAPVIQAGAIVGGAALIGQGIRDSKSTTNVSNGSNATANMSSNQTAISGSSANANSNAKAYSNSDASNLNINGNINGGIHY